MFHRGGFVTFCGLLAGLAGRVRRRTVTRMLLGGCLQHLWPHDRAHYFFTSSPAPAGNWIRSAWPSRSSWWRCRCRRARTCTRRWTTRCSARSGRKVHGAGWQHDGSSPAKNKLSYGNCFVTAAIVVKLPFCSRAVSLPVLGRTRKGKGPGKVDIAAALVSQLALTFPGRAVHVVADAAYHGPALRELPGNVTRTRRIPRNAVLYHLAPPRTGKRGRPRTKGERLGTADDIAAAADGTTVTATAYGRQQTRHAAGITCLWHGSWHTATVRLTLSRDEHTTAGYDLALVTTDPAASPAAPVTRHAARWAIKQASAGARNVLGAGKARNQVRRAAERTVPFAMLAHTLIIIWYARYGHDPADIDDRRTAEPWNRTRTEPAFEDMLIKLRRTLADAVLCAGGPVRNLAGLSLVPERRRPPSGPRGG